MSLSLFSTTLSLLLLFINNVNSACNSSYAGCSSYAQCDVEFVEGMVYGCTGEWETPGVSNGAYLCNDGFEICSSIDDAEALGLTYDLCMRHSDLEKNYYYTTLVGFVTAYDCNENGTDGLVGCASIEDNKKVDWLYYANENETECNMFGAFLDDTTASSGDSTNETNAPAWAYGWEVWQNWENNYADLVWYAYHIERQEYSGGSWTRTTNEYVGGLMCCKSNIDDYTTTSMDIKNDSMSTTAYNRDNDTTTTTDMGDSTTTTMADMTSTHANNNNNATEYNEETYSSTRSTMSDNNDTNDDSAGSGSQANTTDVFSSTDNNGGSGGNGNSGNGANTTCGWCIDNIMIMCIVIIANVLCLWK